MDSANVVRPTEHPVKKRRCAVALLALTLAGCVVVPARPVYYRPAAIVFY